MHKCPFCCPVDIHATKEEVITTLLSDDYRPLVQYYRDVLKEDPDYLRFHSVSTSLRLCGLLKVHEMPHAALIDRAESCSCCVMEALAGAIKQLEKQDAVHNTQKTSHLWRLSMKRIGVSLPVFLLAVSLGLLAPSAAFSGTNTAHARTMKHAMFNSRTIETVQGKVENITTPKARKGMAGDMRLTLKTDKGTLPVILGPKSYVDKDNVKVSKGDDISVTGSRVTLHKKTEIVATEIKKGSETLDLRKSDGTPLWSAKAKQGK